MVASGTCASSSLVMWSKIQTHASPSLRMNSAEEVLEHSRAPHEIADSVHVMEHVMMHFFTQALLLKNLGRPDDQVTAAMMQALMAAEKVAPYRHPKLGAVKLAGDVNNPLRMLDTASKDELKAEIVKHLRIPGAGA